jgi:Pectinacetylesterase
MTPPFVRHASRALPLLTALLLAQGCASDGDGNRQTIGPATTPDTGVFIVDAGLQPPADASAAFDAAIAPARDTGVAPLDTGVAAVEAGPLPDAAVVVADATVDAAGPDAGIGLAGTGLTPFPTSGMPLDTPSGAWKYHEFADTSCRANGKAGITVFRNTASKKLMFFFEGGGACFDALSCVTNPDAVDDGDKAGPSGGILDRSNAANPVKDWNFVYVPYCTGDVFGGTNPTGNVPDVGAQKFVGFLNTQAFLQRIVPTFADMTDVLVTGVSAGGFGASTSVVLVQRAYPNVKVKLINDSGPPMPGSVLAPCLQKTWRETWGYDNSILKDCGAACPKKDDYTFDYGVYLAKTFNNRLSGLIESSQDGIISLFFGAGSDNCAAPFGLAPSIPGPDFQMGLLMFREAVKPYASFGSYLPPSDQHTWLMGASFYTAAIGDTKLIDWVTDIITDKGTKHVGP